MAPHERPIRPAASATRLGAWGLVHACVLIIALAAAARATSAEPAAGSARPDRGAAWCAQVETDPLHRYAVHAFGAPTGCQARIESDDPDEPRFGALVVQFVGGARYGVDSSPPETARMSLRAAGGLPDPARARAALAEQAAAIGLEIDWSRPTRNAGVERFDDPTPGFNASAALRTEGGRLVEVILQMAL